MQSPRWVPRWLSSLPDAARGKTRHRIARLKLYGRRTNDPMKHNCMSSRKVVACVPVAADIRTLDARRNDVSSLHPWWLLTTVRELHSAWLCCVTYKKCFPIGFAGTKAKPNSYINRIYPHLRYRKSDKSDIDSYHYYNYYYYLYK